MRRALRLLLAVLVVAGITAETCPQWRCATMTDAQAAPAEHDGTAHPAMHAAHPAMHAAHPAMHAAHHAGHAAMQHVAASAAHDCCERTGLSRPPCCPTVQVATERVASATGRASDVVQLAAAQPAPFVLPAPAIARLDTPPRFDPGALPGTLIEQHTSLLV